MVGPFRDFGSVFRVLHTRDAQNRVKNRFRVGSKPVPVLVMSSKPVLVRPGSGLIRFLPKKI